MTPEHLARRWLAGGYVFGAVSHVGWVIAHGDVFYHGPAPEWAVWFWYGLCVLDMIEAWLLLAWPRIGLLAGLAIMAFTLQVNWTQFPTFEFGPNLVLWGLTVFGLIVWASFPLLWPGSPWRRPRAPITAAPSRA